MGPDVVSLEEMMYQPPESGHGRRLSSSPQALTPAELSSSLTHGFSAPLTASPAHHPPTVSDLDSTTGPASAREAQLTTGPTSSPGIPITSRAEPVDSPMMYL